MSWSSPLIAAVAGLCAVCLAISLFYTMRLPLNPHASQAGFVRGHDGRDVLSVGRGDQRILSALRDVSPLVQSSTTASDEGMSQLSSLVNQPLVQRAGAFDGSAGDEKMGGNPFVVGGFLGVRGRIVSELLSAARVAFPQKTLVNGDAADFEDVLGSWMQTRFEKASWSPNADSKVPESIKKQTESILESFEEKLTLKRFTKKNAYVLQSVRDVDVWGFQSFQALFLLNELKEKYPNMVFIHVVEDPRFLAMQNDNKNIRRSIRKNIENIYAALIRDKEERPKNMDEDKFSMMRYMKMWKVFTRELYAWGTKNLQNRYLIVKIEDFCVDENIAAQRILKHFSIKKRVSLADIVKEFLANGRKQLEDICLRNHGMQYLYKEHGRAFIRQLTNETRQELRIFGYDDL